MEITKRRLSRKDKNKNKKRWYKDTIDSLDHKTSTNFISFDRNDYQRMKVNYDLFNGIINKADFEHVFKPFGDEVGELPADFSNKDIVSSKIKTLLGMEMQRPFPYRIMAVNEDATTRKEKAEFDMYREFVVQQIMQPIQEQIESQYAQNTEGRELSSEEQEKIQQEIAEQMKARTPIEVKKYMERDHQDPAEVLMQQLLNYGVRQQSLKFKANKAFKHACLSAYEVYWIGIMGEKPVVNVINPYYFECDKAADNDFIEDAEWAGTEFWWTPTQVVTEFGDEMTDKEIDELYEGYNTGPSEEFTFDEFGENHGAVRVLHRTWRALRKMGFLSYIDKKGELQERLVDEDFVMNLEMGHVNIHWEWIPEVYEGYKINNKTYAKLRPVPGQSKNLDNLYEAPLPYVGGIYDNLNSAPTSIMDRIKVHQYYYNIILYRIEELMASDKGKIMLLNMNMIPKSAGIDMKKFLYYAEALKIGFLNPAEEGNEGLEITNAAKEIDMSLTSDIKKYIELAEYMQTKAGDSIGVTPEMEGRINQYQAVRNTEQSLIQSNNILEPYFNFHDKIKANMITAFMNMTRVVYAGSERKVLDYILDDMSRHLIRIDHALLHSSYYGLFVADTTETQKIKDAITTLSQAAMQNQTIELSDVIKVLRNESIVESEETLKVAEKERKEYEQSIKQMEIDAGEKARKELAEEAEREHTREKEKIVLKEEERRKTEIQKQTILAMGFNEDKDMNDNNIPDVLEVAKFGVDAKLKTRKQELDEKKFESDKKFKEKELEIKKKQANKPVQKSS